MVKTLDEVMGDQDILESFRYAARMFHNGPRIVRKMAVRLVILSHVVDEELFGNVDAAADKWLAENYINDIGRKDT